MNTFDIIAFTLAAVALVFSIRNHERINALEKKLKESDALPGDFSSAAKPAKPKPPA